MNNMRERGRRPATFPMSQSGRNLVESCVKLVTESSAAVCGQHKKDE